MPSITGSINSGYRMGRVSASPIEQASGYQAWLKKELIKGAIGVRRGRNGEMFAADWYSPEEALLAKSSYLKKEEEAGKALFEKKKTLINTVRNLSGDLHKILTSDEYNSSAKKGVIASMKSFYSEVMGADYYKKSGIDNLIASFEGAVDTSEIKEKQDVIDINALATVSEAYTQSRSFDDISKYRSVYMKNPDLFKEKGFMHPQDLELKYKSEQMSKLDLERNRNDAQMRADIYSDKGEEEQFQVLTSDGSKEHYGLPKGTVYKVKPNGDVDKLYTPPEKEKLTQKERDLKNRVEAVPKINDEIDKKGPMAAYKRGYKMNDDGTLFTELDTGAAVKLPEFEKLAGKRSATKNLMLIGESMDDAEEIMGLLNDPEVAEELSKADITVLNQVVGKTKNEAKSYLQKKGFAASSPKVLEAIARIGMYASEKRRDISGAAITDSESAFFRSWMPETGDTFEVTLSKVQLAATEGRQEFNRFLDIYKDRAKMAPFYEAFGIDRFNTGMDAEAEALIKQYGTQ